MTRAQDRNALVNAVANTMLAAWEIAEAKPINVSYVSTVTDMARAVIKAHDIRALPPDDAEREAASFMWNRQLFKDERSTESWETFAEAWEVYLAAKQARP